MSNRQSFDGKTSQYASTSIAVYAKNIKKDAQNEEIIDEKLLEQDEESLSDVDDTMNRYRIRYSKKNSTGSVMGSTYGKK